MFSLYLASSSYEPTINEVNVPVLDREKCNEWLVHLNVTDGMLCAGYAEGGKDACQGDSGGPLLCRDVYDRDRYFVAGIVSWGVKCANPRLPGVYANVLKYIPWILHNIQKYSNAPMDYPQTNYNINNYRNHHNEYNSSYIPNPNNRKSDKALKLYNQRHREKWEIQ